MARKDSTPKPHHGFNDIIGIVFIAASLLLVVALFSFDRCDLASVCNPPNSPVHNQFGKFGAWLANGLFFLFGAGAFVMPPLLLAFGLGHLFEFLSYIRRRWLWAIVLFFSFLGLLGIYSGWLERLRQNINAPNAGGILGSIAQNQLTALLGKPGATIIFATIYLVSLIFLTNFQFGEWVRSLLPGAKKVDANATDEEKQLDRKARDLEKQAKKLQEQVDKDKGKSKKIEEPEEAMVSSGLGADGLPVPEPLIRDLSVPTSKPKTKKQLEAEAAEREIQPPDEVIVISASEVAAATSADILGKNGKKADKGAVEAVVTDGEVAEPEKKNEDDEPLPVFTPTVKPRVLGMKKAKPISVASTPLIGNYRLPPQDFLQHPDTTIKPTESKEELMANAQLMKQTLAQFDIDVSVGDITKGPTITRYELHPAPGVRFERITALNNNIAAALKAERINMLAPVPGKSSVGVEVPNLVKTKVIMRDLLESEEWQKSKARIPLALGKDVYGNPIIADLAEMPHLLIAGSTGSGKSVCINSIVASLLYRFSPDQLRFVMIDPKVVELQQYNVLPHLVVPVVTDPKKVILALRWVVNEMEKRYQIFAKVGVRNIKSFNERPKDAPIPKAEPELPLMATKESIEASQDGFAVELDEAIVVPRDEDIVIPEKLSYIVVIIDELADLMLMAPKEVEMAIARITQMARAAG
ncbi:MAG: Cell division protein FtsK, partial [Verrucomicrobiales bacterium]|nr:Cell division protein FtsK [Verrucomicrobiales bacterium]